MMRSVVAKWGNSASVRIPASLMEAARLSLNQPVDIREEGGRIVIEPVQRPRADLSALVDRITPENRHEVVDWGKPVGREVF